jgi:hypothetical protein
MPALVAALHVLKPCKIKDVEGGTEPGHDELSGSASASD